MTAYLPGPWLALVGPTLSVVIDAEWGDPVAEECWALVSRGCGHVELLDVVAALPGFALVGARKLRLAGAVSAWVGDESFSGAGVQTWATHDLPEGAEVRLVIGESEEDESAVLFPLVGGVVCVRELRIAAAEVHGEVPARPEAPALVEQARHAHEPSGQGEESLRHKDEPVGQRDRSIDPAPDVPAQEPVPAQPQPSDGSTQAKSEAKLDRLMSGAVPAEAEPAPEPLPNVEETPVTQHVPHHPSDGATWKLPPSTPVHPEPRYAIPTYAKAPAVPSGPSAMMDDLLGLHAPAATPRPATIPIRWVLVFPAGSPYPLDRAALVGREPGVRGNPQGMTLLEVPQHHTDVSRVHLEVRPGERGVEVINRSEHGTRVRVPGRPASHLGLGENAWVEGGTVLQLSEGFSLTIETGR